MSLRGRSLWMAAGVATLVALTGAMSACHGDRSSEPRIIVLGFDGMDYALTRELMAQGRMPSFSRLAAAGTFAPLETAVPPQSPVAWSSFITGRDPGDHGIYDFVHRDPTTMRPYLSTTRTEPPGRALTLGPWQLPLAGGRVELLRRGEAFWEVLERHGIETTIVRMPANFPPSGRATRELSGMGTPDVLGTYGTFSFYTTNPWVFDDMSPGGGRIHAVSVRDHVVQGWLRGPENPYRREPETVRLPFTVFLDPDRPLAKLVVGNETRVLKVGEWSDWVPITFDLAPWQRLHGICRFYLKEVRPVFQLYASPINFDPLAPAMPVSTPSSYAAELAEAGGRYYTQGMPEDTQALSAEVLSTDEFLAQARLALDETLQQYRVILDRHQRGLLFYYIGNLDQVSHMLWRALDPGHPAYDAERDAPYRKVLEDLYIELDGLVGDTLQRLPAGAKLLVMSDHGFASWRRSFHLNSWLEREGYLTLVDPDRRAAELFTNVDWSRTRAYGLGLNGLYINVRGRERDGIVPPSERAALAAEIAEKLRAFIDPATGEPSVTRAYLREEIYGSVDHPDITPDVIVGYAKGTRGSNESALGEVPRQIVEDNRSHWSGDHCMDAAAVPGVLLTNWPLGGETPRLQTLSTVIMAELGVAPATGAVARRQD